MARTQFTSYAKDRGYKQRNLPTDQILARQEKRDNEIIANAQKNSDAIYNEGQRIHSAIEKNNNIEAQWRDSNKRLVDSYDANRRNAIVKRRDTEVAYYQGKSKSFVEQGKLLSGLAESAGAAVKKVYAENKKIADAKRLQQEIEFTVAKEETLSEIGDSPDSILYWEGGKKHGRLMFNEELYKQTFPKENFPDDVKSAQEFHTILSNVHENQENNEAILADLSEEEKKVYDKYKKRFKELKDTAKSINSLLSVDKQFSDYYQTNVNPYHKAQTKNSQLTLMAPAMLDWQKNVFENLKLKNPGTWTIPQMANWATGMTIKHFGLEDNHTPNSVQIKKQLIVNKARAITDNAIKITKVNQRSTNNDIKDQILAASQTNNYTELNKKLYLMVGIGSVYTSENGDSFETQKDALFGNRNSMLNVILEKQGLDAVLKYINDTGDDKYPSLLTRHGSDLQDWVLKAKKRVQDQTKTNNEFKDLLADTEELNRFKTRLTEPSDDPENPSIYDWILKAKKEDGNLYNVSFLIAKEISGLTLENQVKANALVYKATGLYRFASPMKQADDAFEDREFGTILEILDDPKYTKPDKDRIREKYSNVLNLVGDVKKSDEGKALKSIIQKELGLLTAENVDINHPTLGWAVKQAWYDYADILANHTGEEGNIRRVALDAVTKKIQLGANDINSKYHITRQGEVDNNTTSYFTHASRATDPGFKSLSEIVGKFKTGGDIRKVLSSTVLTSKFDLNEMLSNYQASINKENWKMELTPRMEEVFQIASRYQQLQNDEKPLTRGEFIALSLEAADTESLAKTSGEKKFHPLSDDEIFLDKLKNADTYKTILRASDLKDNITARLKNIHTVDDYVKLSVATSAIKNGFQKSILNPVCNEWLDADVLNTDFFSTAAVVENVIRKNSPTEDAKLFSDDIEDREDILKFDSELAQEWALGSDAEWILKTFTDSSLDEPFSYKHRCRF